MPVLPLQPLIGLLSKGLLKQITLAGKIALASKVEVVLAKEPFSVEEMKLVLGPKLLGWSFMEHNTVKGRFGNRRKPTPDYHWVTNIAAYTGARLGEVAQLTTNGIELRDNIWCFPLITRMGRR